MVTAQPLSRVVIAISAYRSDAQVIRLLEKIFVEQKIEAAGVIVVDSLAEGAIQQRIAAAGWPVRYENSAVNLGSAGNLARRLVLAAEYDADWCFAINHDGMIDREMIETLANAASRHDRVGAVFPKRVWIDRGSTVLKPHTHIFNMPVHAASDDGVAADEVAWDSSNGALYGLQPVREGVRVWGDLWYGWEDLAYGWQLSNAGWKQYYCSDAMYLDDYEYQQVSIGACKMFITRKPCWVNYYSIRNLILIVRRTEGGMKAWTFVGKRVAREVMLGILFRNSKLKRLGYIFKGFAAGIAGETGKAERIP